MKTSLNKVDLSLQAGRFGLRGLEIGNPEGYNTPNLFSLGAGSVEAKLGSLLGKEVVVHEILLGSPELTLERKGLQTNLFAVLKNLKSKEAAPKEKKEAAKGKGKTFRIERIRISDPKLHVNLAGKVTPAVPLPTIELTNVTNADGTPLMAGDVFRQILVAMADSSLKGVKGIVPDDILGSMTEEFASLGDLGGK